MDMEEVWRPVVGYEGLYEVSNLGYVKNIRSGHILSPAKDKDNYCIVCLHNKGLKKNHKIHRLVVEAFQDIVDWIDRVKNKPFSELVINHKDHNTQNNKIENLEVCDAIYNNTYDDRHVLTGKKLTNRIDQSKPVYQYTLNGDLVNTYPSLMECSRQTGYSFAHISSCCLKREHHKTAYGFRWSY